MNPAKYLEEIPEIANSIGYPGTCRQISCTVFGPQHLLLIVYEDFGKGWLGVQTSDRTQHGSINRG